MQTTPTHASTETETTESNTTSTIASISASRNTDRTDVRADALETAVIDSESSTAKTEAWTPARTVTDGAPATFCSHSSTRLENLIDEYNAAVDTRSDPTA
ncbi:hypothetical protein OB919_20430 [Halobacteria archaeon AArc-curdl1]|uniref:Uncharacterized protein n=1 Tax=Natronosalvus hydrolyticus TaxID=2979988 RepID=A0AAP3E9R2_9EURY|nr:hypothetical protein [Halobacteria archaeon AArc-curdl1]